MSRKSNRHRKYEFGKKASFVKLDTDVVLEQWVFITNMTDIP